MKREFTASEPHPSTLMEQENIRQDCLDLLHSSLELYFNRWSLRPSEAQKIATLVKKNVEDKPMEVFQGDLVAEPVKAKRKPKAKAKAGDKFLLPKRAGREG